MATEIPNAKTQSNDKQCPTHSRGHQPKELSPTALAGDLLAGPGSRVTAWKASCWDVSEADKPLPSKDGGRQ
jgi:hypothetical protein